MMKRVLAFLFTVLIGAGPTTGAVQAQTSPQPTSPQPASPQPTSVGSKFIQNFCLEARDDGSVVVNKCDAQPHQALSFDDITGQLVQGANCLAAPTKGQGLVVKTCADIPEQKWNFMPDGTLKSDGGLCADILNFWRDPGTSVIAWDCTATDNQKWGLTRVKLAPSSGTAPGAPAPAATAPAAAPASITGVPLIASYFVQGLCLEASDKHASISIETCGRKTSQSFHFATGNSGQIRQDTQCLASASQGAPLVVTTCDNSPSQDWTFTADGSLRNRANLCADIFKFGTRAGTDVIAWECTGTDNQKWYPAIAAAAGSFAVAPQVAEMLNDGKTTTVSLTPGYSVRNMTGAGGKAMTADANNNVTGGANDTIVVGGAGVKTVNFVKGLAAASVTAAAKGSGGDLLPTDWAFFSGATAGTIAQ